MSNDVVINIAKEFSETPGARFIEEGPDSGQIFRRNYLEQHFADPEASYKITIILDGAAGYATSFLEEAFGGVARRHGVQRALDRFDFVSQEDTLLIEEITEYIKEAKNNGH